VLDPEEAFMPVGGVARRVHADLGSMMIGGLGALLLQALHPLAMAGVADHSSYRQDPLGRLERTAAFVAATTYGSRDDAARAIEQVRAVHRGVRGVAPDGRTYEAEDPDLLTWVHAAEVCSFLGAGLRYGAIRLSSAERDRYYEETARVAVALGAHWVPRSAAEMDAYLRRVRPELYAGPQAMEARDFLVRGVGRRPEDRAVHAVLVGAAIGLLPRWARSELRIVQVPFSDRAFVRPAAALLCAGVRWAVRP
jgi:uncharacterized protein (DUF2236 family)